MSGLISAGPERLEQLISASSDCCEAQLRSIVFLISQRHSQARRKRLSSGAASDIVFLSRSFAPRVQSQIDTKKSSLAAFRQALLSMVSAMAQIFFLPKMFNSFLLCPLARVKQKMKEHKVIWLGSQSNWHSDSCETQAWRGGWRYPRSSALDKSRTNPRRWPKMYAVEIG